MCASAFNVTMKNNYFGYHSTVMPVTPVTVPIPPGTTVGERNWLRLIYRQRVVLHPGEEKKSGKNTRTHSRLGGRGNATRALRLFFYFSTSLALYNMGAVSQTGWKINTNGLQRINRELLFSCCRQSLARGNFTLSSRCLCQRNVSKNLPAVQSGSANRRLLSSVITSVDSSYILLQLSRMNECRVTHLVLFEI